MPDDDWRMSDDMDCWGFSQYSLGGYRPRSKGQKRKKPPKRYVSSDVYAEAKTKLAMVKVSRSVKGPQISNLKTTSSKFFGEKGNGKMADKLYTWTEGDNAYFGYQIATNRAGLAVMELRGTNGEVRIVDPKLLERVLPYTVSVKYAGGSKAYSFFAKEGDWKVGDTLLMDNSFVTVTRLDTKSEAAKRWLHGFKFAGTYIEAPEAEDCEDQEEL